RLYPYAGRSRLVAVWSLGQIGGMALAGYYLLTHVARLRESGMPRGIAETLRVFTYLLSHGIGGTLTLLAFLVGIASLLRRKNVPLGTRPRPRELALLLVLPFVVNCGAALAGIYPYGATRHNAFLALFGLSGASFGLGVWEPRRTWVAPLVLAACLAACNFFPAPPPLIRASNHHRISMTEAVGSLRKSVAPGSILFADYESGLL